MRDPPTKLLVNDASSLRLIQAKRLVKFSNALGKDNGLPSVKIPPAEEGQMAQETHPKYVGTRRGCWTVETPVGDREISPPSDWNSTPKAQSIHHTIGVLPCIAVDLLEVCSIERKCVICHSRYVRWNLSGPVANQFQCSEYKEHGKIALCSG